MELAQISHRFCHVRQKGLLTSIHGIAFASTASGRDLVFGADKVLGEVKGAANTVRDTRAPELDRGPKKSMRNNPEGR